MRGDVEFYHVTFAYEGGPPAVSELDLLVKAGTTVALVGNTGAGKSTAMALLHRLADPQPGASRSTASTSATSRSNSLRHNIGVVFQEITMFYRSIADNLRVGRPDATDEELIEAAKLAEAHDFIVRQPQGYDTPSASAASRFRAASASASPSPGRC